MASQKHINNEYFLIDSGGSRKLEKFGPFFIARPCAQAVWQPNLDEKEWNKADAIFTRDPDNTWIKKSHLPESWIIETADIKFKLSPTDFGHLGIFPEQRPFWKWINDQVVQAKTAAPQSIKVLNLFAYSGGSTLAAAKAGAQVCHLDASKGMVAWARENAALNQAQSLPIRWIVDDVSKFLARELRRGSRYDAIILDPPTFGRGGHGEIFKIEDDIIKLLQSCRHVLVDNPLFILFSCHTPGFTPITMRHLMQQMMEGISGQIEAGEMTLTGDSKVLELPSGTYARWQRG